MFTKKKICSGKKKLSRDIGTRADPWLCGQYTGVSLWNGVIKPFMNHWTELTTRELQLKDESTQIRPAFLDVDATDYQSICLY